MNRRLLVALLALVALAAGSVASFAYLSTGTTSGSAGRAVAGGMSAPANVSADLVVAGADDVTVTWGAATRDGLPVERYTVRRGATTVCPNVTDAARTCSDADVAAGTHTYTVTAVYKGWTTEASDAITVAQQDTTGPTVTLEQAQNQPDPTKTLPITFAIRFNEVVTDFDRNDITRAGSANPALDNLNVTPSGNGRDYTVTVDNTPTLASGAVVLSIPAGAAHDAAGNGNSASTGDGSVGYDITGPQHSLSLFGTPVGAYLNPAGTALYYRGVAAGNFRLANAATDALSTVASVTYPAIATGIGWTHTTAETVSTPAGGPFVSSAYGWQGNPGNPQPMSITALDSLGNSSSTSVGFLIDNLPAPAGSGSISYSATPRNVASVPVSLTNGTDNAGGSGIASHRLQRRSGAITSTGTCTPAGTFADVATNPVPAYSDTGVSNGNCYEYQYVITDNVGNVATRTPAATTVVPVDTVAPTPSSTATTNRNGTVGRIDSSNNSGNHDRLTFTYADVAGLGVDPSSIIAGWDGSGSPNVSVTYTNGASGGNDMITVPGLGTVDLGSSTWLSSTSTHTATLQMNSLNVFELRIATTPTGATTGNAASNFTWSTSSGTAKDKSGNVASGSATSNGLQF